MDIDRDATVKRAEKLLRQGRLDAAIAEYVRVASTHPADWSTVNLLGDLYLRAGQVDRAVLQFARVGEHLVRERSYAKAAAVYKKILRISPGDARGTRGLELVASKESPRAPRNGSGARSADDPDARMAAARQAQDGGDVPLACTLLVEAADLYASQGRHADALAAIAEASSIDPANADYRQRLLKMLIAQGELTQARCVARVVPELVLVADALDRAGRHADAADTIAEAALIDPGDRLLRERGVRDLVASGLLDKAGQAASTPEDLRVLAGALHEQRLDAEAVALVAEAVDREPLDPGRRATLVETCLAAGDIDRAREAARTAADWMLLTTAMREQGRMDEALAAMREATQRDPHDVALHADLVRAYLEAGQTAQAREEARTKAEAVMVADAFDARGEPDDARRMRADALRREPDDPLLRVRLIRDYLDGGDRTRAHALLTLDVAGRDAELILLLARLEFGIGRLEEGRRALQHLRTIAPRSLAAVASLGRELLDEGDTDAGFVCTDLVAEAAIARGDTDRAVAVLQEFVRRVPDHVSALLKLIEMAVDGGLLNLMSAAQEQLADAYLRAGKGAEARVIAEDLVLRAPWDRAKVERLLRALVLAGDPEPEQTIAATLCGDGSLMIEES